MSIEPSYLFIASYLVCTGTNGLTTLVHPRAGPLPPGAISNLTQSRVVSLKDRWFRMAWGLRTTSAHDGYTRPYEFVLRIPVDVV